ncbi:type VII secretion protein EssC [Alkaliphilus transvaalensis]|uniref:type VII secretion protein EssC n=1 Tax=Alkaliphilus transvaalensis TaxID=114628 RepID=UPI000685CA04|nr:type VII secretion protein EssC [Alkaliphilus transvaalensis]
MKNRKYEFSRQPRFLPEMPVGEVEVPNPPSQYQKPEISWFALLVPPAVMLIITVMLALSTQSVYMMIGIATTIMTVIASLVGATTQIKKYKAQKENREKKYLQLIADIRSELTLSKEQQNKSMNEANPEPAICLQRIVNTDNKLWERTPAYSDFLSVRIGIGTAPAAVKVKYSKQQMVLDNDPLALEPEKVALEYGSISGVPISLEILSSEIAGIAGAYDRTLDLLRVVMLQIITHHGYDDVKVVLLLKGDNFEKWQWARHLPHLWDQDYKTRYMLCGKAIAHQTLGELNDLFKARELKSKGTGQMDSNLPHYVFIVEDTTLLENEGINKYIFNKNRSIGISTIFIAENRAFLPMNCNTIIDLQGKNGEYINRETGEKNTFTPDKLELFSLERAVMHLSPVRIKSSEASFSLPKSITLLEMMKANKVEEVNVVDKWEKNRTYMGMKVPIGARAGGELFHLDLHETGFGPHGLVAGTTGSGKSELLQSIIISLAINYHPHDVVFVLIDYKGGGMADVFKGMPHLVGTITNLGGNQTTRALLSIKSELQRRQRIFSQYGVNNIDKYQKLYHNINRDENMPPIPHLVMIADEFAELKQEQPDFMKELVSTARVGRSLGVHLILATQKPAGVVDDQIWSNSKFKICLKVQDEADSKDVIKRPDAAMIKEPGRAYIQVGNDEIFEMFQSTYSGADYDPSGILKQDQNIKKRIYSVSLNGKQEQIYPIEEEKIANVELDSQLKAMVEYISESAENNNIEALKGPWLPPLAEELYLDDLYNDKEVGFNYELGAWAGEAPYLSPNIGILDDPRAQHQIPLALDFAKEGHLFIYGSPGTGKTFLMETLCLSLAHLHSPEEVNMYIMDFGGTAFKQFEGLPHCGGVMTIEQESRINQFMLYIFRCIEERKRIFERTRSDSFINYKAKNKEPLPAIFILIDNYFALSETYEKVDDEMIILAREGTKYGIYLIASATNATLVKYKFAVNFKMAVTLQLTDKSEYDSIVGRTEGLEPASVVGRGLVRNQPPLEFHTALPAFKERDTEKLISIFEEFAAKGVIPKARPIPEMPTNIDITEINQGSTGKLAIGLSAEDLQPVCVDLRTTPTIMIAGDSQTGKSTLLLSWTKLLTDQVGVDNIKIYAQDSNAMGIYPMMSMPNVVDLSQVEDMYGLIESLTLELDNRREQLKECKMNGGNLEEIYEKWQQIVFVFDNLLEFTDGDNFSLKDLLERVVKKDHGLKVAVLAVGTTSDFEANWDNFGKSVRETQTGILLGSIKDQGLFNVRLPYGTTERELEMGDGYLITKNKYKSLRVAHVPSFIEND